MPLSHLGWLAPELLVTNFKRSFTGVSASANALLPVQSARHRLCVVGYSLPASRAARDLWQAIRISSRPPMGRPFRIWHVRRNVEMVAALFVRDILRYPIRIVFTSAARRLHSWFPRRLIARMDAVIATTDDAASYVPRVAVVAPHGVDLENFTPAGDRAAEWARSDLPGRYGIGIFGRVRPEKGTDLFVAAMLQLLPLYPDFTAVILGRWKRADAPFQRKLAEAVDAAGLADRIRFLGEAPPTEVPSWMRRLSIVVAPGRYEGFGMTVLEAMASGAAAVASRTGFYEQAIVPGVTGALVDPGDAAALAAALAPIMADPALAWRMGGAGRRRAVEFFSIGREADAAAAVYERLWAGGQF